MSIEIDSNVKPVRQPLRPVPIGLEPLVEDKLNELLRLDMIEKVTGSTKWVSPLVPVLKGNGNIRLCMDMRAANKAVVLEKHPLPSIDYLTAKLSESKVFSTLDLVEAFHHVEVEEDSREILTFISHKGLFRFKVLVYGLNVSPAKFQQIMVEYVLQDLDGVEVYMDDFIVHGRDQEEHDNRLRKTLNRLEELGLKVNYGKCQINQREVKFIGHIISSDGS